MLDVDEEYKKDSAIWQKFKGYADKTFKCAEDIRHQASKSTGEGLIPKMVSLINNHWSMAFID